MLYIHISCICTDAGCVQVTNVNAKGAFFFLREAGRTLSDGGKIITCVCILQCNSDLPTLRTQLRGHPDGCGCCAVQCSPQPQCYTRHAAALNLMLILSMPHS
jgi:hypothetical protein